jgi:subtilisin family serine protease
MQDRQYLRAPGQSIKFIKRKKMNLSKKTKNSRSLAEIARLLLAAAAVFTYPAAQAQSWSKIADEGVGFTVSGKQIVRYGAAGAWLQKNITQGGDCTNTYFGSDPIPGTFKQCQMQAQAPGQAAPTPTDPDAQSPHWQPWLREGQTGKKLSTDFFIGAVNVALHEFQRVRYGISPNWVYKNVFASDVQDCSTAAFTGVDPAYGVAKFCQVFKPWPTQRADNDNQRDWNQASINLPAAHAITKGAVASKPVGIAILDGGRSDHPALAGKWMTTPSGALVEYDATANLETEPTTASLKGQYSAALMASGDWAHAAHIGGIVASICPECKMMPVKIKLGDPVNSDRSIARGIRWAIANGAKIINLSFQESKLCETPSYSSPISHVLAAIQDANAAGVMVVAAAGNWNPHAVAGAERILKNEGVSTIFPANCPGVISVGATNRQNKKSEYYLQGDKTKPMGFTMNGATVMAPGGGIEARLGFKSDGDEYTTGVLGAPVGCPRDHTQFQFYASNSNRLRWTSGVPAFEPIKGSQPGTSDTFESIQGIYSAWTSSNKDNGAVTHCNRYLSGTSMAAPHVAATLGLMVAAADGNISAARAQALLLASATPMTPSVDANCWVNGQNVCGAGLLNAGAAVQAAALEARKTGPCSFAPAGTACQIDAIAYDTAAPSNSTQEIVIAYGRMWKFHPFTGALIMPATPLTDIPRYATGPCARAPAGQTCVIDSLTIASAPWGYVESISAYGYYWNFDINGTPWSGVGSHADLKTIDRYFTAGASFGGSAPKPCTNFRAVDCKFDTRTLVDWRDLYGDVYESITASGQYFLFNSGGTMLATGQLLSVPRYANGPCAFRPSAASVCRFDSLDFKRENGYTIEVIIAYGRYWEFVNGSDVPTAQGNGSELKNVARFK